MKPIEILVCPYCFQPSGQYTEPFGWRCSSPALNEHHANMTLEEQIGHLGDERCTAWDYTFCPYGITEGGMR